MKRTALGGMLLVATALTFQYQVSCQGTQSPTGSSPGGSAASPAPAPSTDPPSVVTPSSGEDGAGTLSIDLSPRTSETEWCVDASNGGDNLTRWVTVACYNDPDRSIPGQTLFSSTPGKLGAGESALVCAAKPCGKWQCDAVDLRGLPPKTNPEFGSNLLLGRIGTNRDQGCEPPIEPPPTTTTTPRLCEPPNDPPWAARCSWDAYKCEWKCEPHEDDDSSDDDSSDDDSSDDDSSDDDSHDKKKKRKP